MNSYYSHPKAKEEIRALYQEKLDELPIQYEMQTVETSFGNTNIVVTGPAEKPPLVLLHGSNGCAPVAIEALIGLVDDYRVYAIDVIGQPNLSAETRPDMKGDSYGQWMHEILSRLNLSKVFLAGISFGGFVSWKTLVFDEKRIARAFLIVPAGIVDGNPLQALRKVFLPMKMYMWRKKEHYVHRFLEALFTERDTFAIRFLAKVFLHFKMDFSPIPRITKEEAKRITTPLTIVAAEHDLLFPGEKMRERARAIFPSLEEVLLLKDNKHVPDWPGNAKIVEIIKNHTP